MTQITHALISVSNKEGIVEFAKALTKSNIIIISTGGTASLLQQHHIPVIEVSDFTGFPEMFAGRVKTLHPKLYGGILARGDQDQETLIQYDIPVIGLVVVNLYPFQEVIAKENFTLSEAIENIDIGGPTLLRAAAKNYQYTTVVVSKEDYPKISDEISKQGYVSHENRFELAKKVFSHVAEYDAAISNYLSALKISDEKIAFPTSYTVQLQKKLDLRYGENPHQQAAFYTTNQKSTENNISTAVLRNGKPLSYNNIADADCALECVRQFQETACVIVKHANPCAVSTGQNQLEAYQKAFAADQHSAFGGIIAFNKTLELRVMQEILHQFVEVIIAPEITSEALELAKTKPNIRILTVGELSKATLPSLDYKSVTGGILIQTSDNQASPLTINAVTHRKPTREELQDLLFAWKVVRFVKSNAIVYAKELSTLGIGPGQMSRVFSSKIAILKAEEASFSLKGAVMASDAFFPFRDSIDEAAKLGISAIIQPGGSIRDEEIIKAANELNIAMVFTNIRHFRH